MKRAGRRVAAVALCLAAAALVAVTLAGAAAAPGPTCSVQKRWFVEGDTGVSGISFRVPCTSQPAPGTTFRITTSDGTAVAPDDYLAWDSTAGVTAGAYLEITVGIVGDMLEEPDETFTLTLSDPSGTLAFDPPAATMTILDDEGPPRPQTVCTVPDVQLAEGDTGLTPTTFAITCDPFLTADMRFRVQTADGTALAGEDYAAIDGNGSVLAGSDVFYGAVHAIGDRIDEPDETFTYTITDLAGEVAFTTGTFTVVDDDEPGGPPGPCILLSETDVAVEGTLSTPTRVSVTTTADVTVTNCGDGDVQLDVRGTDATGADATWELTDEASGGGIDSTCALGLDIFRAAVFVARPDGGATGTPFTEVDRRMLAADGLEPLRLAPAAAQVLSPQLELPCEGSSGAGGPMTTQITFTAVAP